MFILFHRINILFYLYSHKRHINTNYKTGLHIKQRSNTALEITLSTVGVCLLYWNSVLWVGLESPVHAGAMQAHSGQRPLMCYIASWHVRGQGPVEMYSLLTLFNHMN